MHISYLLQRKNSIYLVQWERVYVCLVPEQPVDPHPHFVILYVVRSFVENVVNNKSSLCSREKVVRIFVVQISIQEYLIILYLRLALYKRTYFLSLDLMNICVGASGISNLSGTSGTVKRNIFLQPSLSHSVLLIFFLSVFSVS